MSLFKIYILHFVCVHVKANAPGYVALIQLRLVYLYLYLYHLHNLRLL